jgi:hypothetical protein
VPAHRPVIGEVAFLDFLATVEFGVSKGVEDHAAYLPRTERRG